MKLIDEVGFDNSWLSGSASGTPAAELRDDTA